MSLFYDAIYVFVLLAAMPWLMVQSWRTGKYREGWREKFLGSVPLRVSSRPCIWFHAVSVGEVNLLVRLRQQWKAEHPDWEVVISSTTKTGLALAKERFPEDRVIYCPLDFSWAVSRALQRLRPNLLVLAELELWPNLIRLSKHHGASVAIVNGRLSESSFRGYRRVRGVVGQWLRRLDWIATQTETYAERFRNLGADADAVENTGSLKFDRAEFDRGNPRTSELAKLVGLKPDDPVWVVGSTQAPEEALALRVYQQLAQDHPRLKLIIVPRHAERFDEVARCVADSSLVTLRRSELTQSPAADWQVLTVDTIGELGAWWGTATVAFVGGSMGSRGGQNMIEPAAYGAAVCFGPNTKNFRDVVQLLLANDAARVVTDERELQAFVRWCLDDRASADRMGQRACALVKDQQGATTRTIRGLARLAEQSQANAEALRRAA